MRGQRLYDIKHDYFDNIDTSMKAYLLGFLIADGTIEINQTGRFCIRFIQKKSDAAILDLIKTEISPSSKIEVITRGIKVYNRLSITSTPMGDALIKLGIHPRKTYLEFSLPVVKSILQRDMIRGYFDGDGTAGVYLNGTYVVRQVRIASFSQTILSDIEKILRKKHIDSTVFQSGTYWYLKVNSYKQWYNYIYPGITTFERKQKNCGLCMLTSSEIRSLKASDPCNA